MAPPLDLDVIHVTVNRTAQGIIANPSSFTALTRREDGDTVHFYAREAFSISFENDATPFEWLEKTSGDPEDGFYMVTGTVKPNLVTDEKEQRIFTYGITMGEATADPDVVVKKDPNRP